MKEETKHKVRKAYTTSVGGEISVTVIYTSRFYLCSQLAAPHGPRSSCLIPAACSQPGHTMGHCSCMVLLYRPRKVVGHVVLHHVCIKIFCQ